MLTIQAAVLKNASLMSAFILCRLVSVCCRTPTLVELMNENGEYRPNKSNQAEQPETIKERQNAGLLLQQGVNLGHSAHGCVSCGITVSDEAICNVLHILRKRSIETREVCHQHRLVVLSAPREHRRHERNAKASTLIAEKVGEARRFVVFVLGQKGVGELASWDKQEGDPEALNRACPGFFSVVGCKIETREYHMAHPRTVKPNPIIQDTGILFTSRTISGAITTITIAPGPKTKPASVAV